MVPSDHRAGTGLSMKRHRLPRVTVGAMLLVIAHLLAPRAESQDDPVREALRARVEALRETGRLDVRGSRIASAIVLPGRAIPLSQASGHCTSALRRSPDNDL
jgi:hypothetical protein